MPASRRSRDKSKHCEQLHLIADAWDKVVRAHDENVQRLTRPDQC
jgi:hypothetical protein